MNIFEQLTINVRRNSRISTWEWLWSGLRPLYNRGIALLGRKGLRRTINGTDRIRVLPEFRGVGETYEPEFWGQLLACAKPGSLVADVGAYIGLYTVALAQRVGPGGRVLALEPDPQSYKTLKRHLRMNNVSANVRAIQAAAGVKEGSVLFESGKQSMSHVVSDPAAEMISVPMTSLDHLLSHQRLDLLKIDVEGYEEQVLLGAASILSDVERAPHTIFIEVHPYAWGEMGTTGESLMEWLERWQYDVFDLAGKRVEGINDYGQIVARRRAHPSPLKADSRNELPR